MELRRYPRGNVAESQLLTVDMLFETGQQQRGIVLNVSEGGLAVQSFRPPALATVGDFRVALPGVKENIEAKGTIAWVGRGGRAGVHFIDSSRKVRIRLREMVRNQQLLQPDATASIPLPERGLDEFDSALQLIVERAMATTKATGAAIAIGDSTFMECRASAGAAPALGVPLHPDAGLSGLCLRTGSVVHCADALSDPRIDAPVAGRLGMRSIVILPVLVSGKIAGVLEVFSSAPDAFEAEDLKGRLQFLAELLTAAIEENRLADTKASQRAASLVETSRESPTPSVTNDNTLHAEAYETTTADQDSPHFLSRPLFSFPGKIPLVFAAIACASLAAGWYYAQKHVPPAQLASPTGQHGEMLPAPSTSVPKRLPGVHPVISFAPSKLVEKVGASFTVDVLLKDAPDVSSVPLQIVYDPKVLQFVGIAFGDLLDGDGQSGTLVHREDSAEGKIRIAASLPPSAPGISGNGVVCTLIFLARAPGRSNLSVNQQALRDPSMQVIAADTSNATVTVAR